MLIITPYEGVPVPVEPVVPANDEASTQRRANDNILLPEPAFIPLDNMLIIASKIYF